MATVLTASQAEEEVAAPEPHIFKEEEVTALEPNIFADKEHLDIHLNKHVADLMTQINKSDKLVLVYIYNSVITV